MKCRKCKMFSEEGDIDYFIVHLITTHGQRKIRVLSMFTNANKDNIEELLKEEHKTGKASAYRFKKV